MQVFHGLETIPTSWGASIVTLGNFDGVHLGHQSLMKQVVELGQRKNLQSVVVTFSPHPAQVLFPEKNFEKLFDENDLEDQLRSLNIAALVVIPFNIEIAKMKAQEFLDEIIVKKLNPKEIVVGYDFALGAGREGHLDFLKNYCGKNKIGFQVVDALTFQGEVVSSSLIRVSLQNGQPEKARQLLGRDFYFRGVIFRGAQRGRTIGVPTANLRPTVNLTPKKGVYASWFRVKDQWHASITNVGLNPTVSKDEQLKIETHLFDFDEDIYDQSCEVRLMMYLREEKKFSDFNALKNQIMDDLVMAQRILKNELPPA